MTTLWVRWESRIQTKRNTSIFQAQERTSTNRFSFFPLNIRTSRSSRSKRTLTARLPFAATARFTLGARISTPKPLRRCLVEINSNATIYQALSRCLISLKSSESKSKMIPSTHSCMVSLTKRWKCKKYNNFSPHIRRSGSHLTLKRPSKLLLSLLKQKKRASSRKI